MADVQLRVGASIDASLTAALQPVVATARRAREVVQSEAEAAAKAKAKAAEKAATAEEAAVQKALKALERANAKAVADAERTATREAAAAERAAQAKVRSELRAFDQKIKASARAAAAEERDIERVAAAAERAASRRAAAAERAASREATAAARGENRRGLDFARGAAGSFGRIAGAAGRLGLDVARGAGVNFDVGATIGKVVDQQRVASQIANSGYLEGDARNGVRQSGTTIHHEARAAALGAGISTEDALGGLQQMVGKSSDLATSREILGDMAKLSKALGANMEDVGAAAGEVSLRLGDIPNKGKVITNIMAVIAQQGKTGAIEMREMAKNLGTVMASAGKFGSGPEQAAKDLGALFQVAKKGGSKNAASSATGVSSFVAGLTNPAELKRLNAMGINVFANKEHTKFNSVGEIAGAALFKTGGDLGKLGGVFKNQRAMSVVSGLGQVYGDAEKEKKGSGVEAVKAYFEKMGKGMSQEDLAASLKEAMGTSATKVQQFNTQMEEVGEKLAGKLLPAFEKFEPYLLKGADALAHLVDIAVDNPGSAIIAAIVASIAKAAIGDAIGQAIKGMISGGAGGAAGGALGSAGTLIGAAGVGVAIGAGAMFAGAANNDAVVDRAGERQDAVQENLAKVRQARNNGTASKESEVLVQQVAASVTNLSERIRDAERSQGLAGLTNFLSGEMSYGDIKKGAKDTENLPALKAALSQQSELLKNLTTATLKVQVVNMPTVPQGSGPIPGWDAGAPAGS